LGLRIVDLPPAAILRFCGAEARHASDIHASAINASVAANRRSGAAVEAVDV
jgi:hypothetical protein